MSKIGIIDDHSLVLSGLVQVLGRLAGEAEIVGAVSSQAMLKRIRSGERFDIIICDLIMDGMNGLAFIKALQANHIRIPVLLMSGMTLDPPLAEMKSLGAQGFIHKSADPDYFVEAVKTVLSGQTHFPDDLAESPEEAQALEIGINLTARQLDVLKLLAGGASNREIAEALSVSENTVKTHVKNLFLAFDVSRRTACVQKARLVGIL